jgi:hypothetical protein
MTKETRGGASNLMTIDDWINPEGRGKRQNEVDMGNKLDHGTSQ